jgi:hypothetical protein
LSNNRNLTKLEILGISSLTITLYSEKEFNQLKNNITKDKDAKINYVFKVKDKEKASNTN